MGMSVLLKAVNFTAFFNKKIGLNKSAELINCYLIDSTKTLIFIYLKDKRLIIVVL